MLSRNGVNESELLQLVPLKWSEWVPLSEALHQRQIIITRLGLIQLANEQVCFALSTNPFNHFTPDCAKFETDKFSKFINWLKLKNSKVLLNSFPVNGHT